MLYNSYILPFTLWNAGDKEYFWSSEGLLLTKYRPLWATAVFACKSECAEKQILFSTLQLTENSYQQVSISFFYKVLDKNLISTVNSHN